MKTISNPSQSKRKKLAERPMIKQRKLMNMVEKIFYNIHRRGDKAVLTYSRQFDWPAQERLEVDRETIEQATELVSERLKQAIELARKNIEAFHRSQQEEESGDSSRCSLLARIATHHTGGYLHTRWHCSAIFNGTDACHTCKNCRL